MLGFPAAVDGIHATCAAEHDTVFCVLLLFFCEEAGVIDGVGEEEEDGDGPGAGYYAEDLGMLVR